MVVSGKNCNASNEMLRCLHPSLFNPEKFVMMGRSRYLTPEHTIELILVLPGRIAKSVRAKFANIIARYLDDKDGSLCKEVEENKSMGRIKSFSKFASDVMGNIDDANIQKSHEMPQTFYVYATKSPAFPGLIKIGKTENVSRRVCQLNTACAPAPHVIVAVAPSFDTGRDETTAHEFFSNARREGEFFELQDAEVLAYFATHITAQYNTELGQNISKLHGLSV